MYLILDFAELGLKYAQTDIRFDEKRADYTVGEFIRELCNGLETICGQPIRRKENVCLLGPLDEDVINPKRKVSDLCQQEWNDWDILYLLNGGS